MNFPAIFFQVNIRSLGEAAGLHAGDVISAVNGQDISLLKHKEAQEAIKVAGNNFVLTIFRYELILVKICMYVVHKHKVRSRVLLGKNWELLFHTSEISGLCLMKFSSETLYHHRLDFPVS